MRSLSKTKLNALRIYAADPFADGVDKHVHFALVQWKLIEPIMPYKLTELGRTVLNNNGKR